MIGRDNEKWEDFTELWFVIGWLLEWCNHFKIDPLLYRYDWMSGHIPFYFNKSNTLLSNPKDHLCSLVIGENK